jgi:hypothetical protein
MRPEFDAARIERTSNTRLKSARRGKSEILTAYRLPQRGRDFAREQPAKRRRTLFLYGAFRDRSLAGT